ncbi:MAG: histidyl-tRNA synthetase [Parcubacteria group bacterium Gr01-1014_18]|nr:MAG: histidyl-tRNA synthetase [Parcubacteria group bacterium Greene0416_36]TSC79516.1 MAG: histidyl-tRNA synthetase [Parcubacteria group bacterium Gr01-1014_18]TSC97822.1 MAG: histidyl-tRNA synthetase [Parcubacteria group bacterium Greene1014_20]TSD05951.1 MAG: histidyl-tRNA synthetase [Parcubacteria group bacterium Greene0714_2]
MLETAKGVRDFLPEQKIKRDYLTGILKTIFERYGYNPLETSILERYELFASKYGAGEGSDQLAECFKLTDRGDRKLVLRPELTVPFARVVGMYKNELKMPFKRYEMGSVFRDGPLKPGRYRQFWQCDVDVVGAPVGAIDAEIIQLAADAFSSFGLDVEIRMNNRKVLNAILEFVKVIDPEKQKEVLIVLDKWDKIGKDGVCNELKSRRLLQELDLLMLILGSFEDGNRSNLTFKEQLNFLRTRLKDVEGIRELEEISDYFIGDSNNIKFVPYLARGLAYYTGTIFEVFLKDRSKISSSLAGGGRYDNMIGGFMEDGKIYPAVGISFGLETILDALELSEKKQWAKTIAQVYVFGDISASMSVAKSLRNAGVNVEVDYLSRNFKKNLEYANALAIPFVVILGEDEIKSGTATVKEMKSGEQEKVEMGKLGEYLVSRL